MAATLEKLVKVRSQFIEEVVWFLKEVGQRCGTLPPLYPGHFQFDEVRVRVKVRKERRQHDENLERERERLRREGLEGFDDEHQSPYAHRSLHIDEAEKAPTAEILEWDKLRNKLHRGVALGDPGFGKTWRLKYEARRIAHENAEKLRSFDIGLEDVVIPVFIRLSDLAKAKGEIPVAVCDVLKRNYIINGKELSKRLFDMLEAGLNTDRCRLLLDALDEVPLENRRELVERLSRFKTNYPNCRILLTSRIVGYEQPFRLANNEQEREIELVPFDRSQQGQFIETWFKDRPDDAKKLQNELRKATQIRGLAQVPLLLGFLCKLYWHNDLTPPFSRVELYEKVLNSLLGEEWKETGEKRKKKAEQLVAGYVGAKLELAEAVAYRLFTQHKEICSLDELRHCIGEVLAALSDYHEMKRKTLSEIVHELSVEDGLLVKEGEQYRFAHLTLQEYLTASALAKRDDWLKEAKRHFWFDARWVEVLTLLAGLVKKPDELLAAILAEQEDIFGSMLILAGRCLSEAGAKRTSGSSQRSAQQELEKKIVGGLLSLLSGVMGSTASAVLAQIGSDTAVKALRTVLRAYWSVRLRSPAARALGQIGNDAAAEALLTALRANEGRPVRDFAEQIESEAALLVLLEPWREVLLTAWRADESYDVRSSAVMALGEIAHSIELSGKVAGALICA